MKQHLTKLGFTSDDLDSIVHDYACELASNANNGGLGDQLSFLSINGMSNEQIYNKLLSGVLRQGMTVSVMEPQFPDSGHSYAFSGIVVEVQNNSVVVCDQEDNHFDVYCSEIESYEI